MAIDLLKEVKKAKTIGISAHVRPDGDAVGSVMAVYLYLKKNLPADVKVIPILQTPADVFNCIKGVENICTDFNPGVDEFDAYIGLDCSSKDRYGDAEVLFDNAKKKIVIDHHVIGSEFGDVRYCVPEASSTCELVYDCMDSDKIDIDIATAIYIGIIHDTGVLRYNCTSPKTLRTVADLIGYGFDFNKLIDETFYEKTMVQNEMLGRCLLESILFNNGKCIVAKVDKSTMDFYGASHHDLDGIVEMMRNTKGVEVSILLDEIEPMKYKVSLRSKGAVNVAKIAQFYGGGGHDRAAGFSMSGTFYDCVNNISDSIMMQLEEA